MIDGRRLWLARTNIWIAAPPGVIEARVIDGRRLRLARTNIWIAAHAGVTGRPA